jgi:hypothetical protein
MTKAITPYLSITSSQTKMTTKSIITNAIAVVLLGLSQQALAHIEYYDLNQGLQIGDLTTAGKIVSTAQYGTNPVVSGFGVGAATNTKSDRPLNDPTQWVAPNQVYTGVGNFSGVTYDAATGVGTATVTVNDVTDYGWGDGTKTTLGDTHKVDFFNFRLAQAAIVTISWNVGDATAYYDSGFTLYKGVGSYQGHDDAVDSLNPKAGVPPVKKQNAFDIGFVTDAQGITAPYRNTATGAPTYTGQFDAFHGWGDGNTAGNWSTLEFNTAVHTLRGTVGADGYSFNAADTLQTLTITLQPGNYTIAASGALNSIGSQPSFGATNLNGVLIFKAKPTPLNQTIGTINIIPTLATGASTKVSATSSSGLAVIFSSTTPAICSVTGTNVTGIANGTCIIAANQAGNANYNPAPQKTQSISIGGSQTITFGTMPNILVGVTSNISASSSSGLPLTFSTSTANICSVSGSLVTGIALGNCSITANQAGNANYLAASQVTKSVTILGTQSISFGAAPDIAVNNAVTLSATSSSGLSVSLTSTTLGICAISGNIVTGVGSGNCIIAANQAGNNNYIAAAQVTQTFLIKKYTQVLIFSAAPSIATGKTGIVSIPNGAKLSAFFTWRNPVVFTSTTPGICTVSATIVTGKAAGICTIAANQAGNIHYSVAAQVTQSLTIRP